MKIETKIVKLNARRYRVTNNDGWLYVEQLRTTSPPLLITRRTHNTLFYAACRKAGFGAICY